MLKKRVGRNKTRQQNGQAHSLKKSVQSQNKIITDHVQSQSNHQHPDYEKLGKMLFAIGETGTKNRSKLYKIAFWKGVWSGLGGVVGATIIVSLLLLIFNALGSVPLIGEFIDIVERSVPSNNLE